MECAEFLPLEQLTCTKAVTRTRVWQVRGENRKRKPSPLQSQALSTWPPVSSLPQQLLAGERKPPFLPGCTSPEVTAAVQEGVHPKCLWKLLSPISEPQLSNITRSVCLRCLGK
ncbi:hypothetical protein MHYP_G00236620 [Metynnis hypsauchen]